LISGIIYAQSNHVDPTLGYNIHVSVGRHDHANLDAQFDHFCKLTPPIVATCQIYAEDSNGDHLLSQIEFIITRDQYLQLPLRDRQNWHDHAVELTAERGLPACISLPEGLDCNTLVGILHQTYGKVVTLWDPADPVPNYQPYVYWVDSPFALEQDLNHELHKIWPVGDETTSSANSPPTDDDSQAEGNVIFRTSVFNGDHASTSDGWIALDRDGDNSLEGYGFAGRSSFSNSRCNNVFSCAASEVPCIVAVTPDGFNVVDYGGRNNRLLVCDLRNNRQVFYEPDNENAGNAVLSSDPTEPFTSNRQEVLS